MRSGSSEGSLPRERSERPPTGPGGRGYSHRPAPAARNPPYTYESVPSYVRGPPRTRDPRSDQPRYRSSTGYATAGSDTERDYVPPPMARQADYGPARVPPGAHSRPSQTSRDPRDDDNSYIGAYDENDVAEVVVPDKLSTSFV